MLLGIDPGVRNLGLAVIDYSGELVLSRKMDLSEFKGMTEFIDRIIYILVDEMEESITNASIERFVSYGNVQTKDTEKITMLIGGLVYAFNSLDIEIDLYRAIEWKPALCKHLVKYNGFDNPSTKFDKAFDIAAARCITGSSTDSANDHEADAICLAYMWNVKQGIDTRSNRQVSKGA